ncbi:MAG: hypothetical protein AB7O78_16420 [Thermoleophilia bacterium]
MASALRRLDRRLQSLTAADASLIGVGVLIHADAAARLARRADRELAEAGFDAVERAELIVGTAELRVLADGAAWPELRSRAAQIALGLHRRPAPPRRPARRAWGILAAVSAATLPWPMRVQAHRPDR